MTYSVWDPLNKVYRYYETPGNEDGAPTPSHVKSWFSTPIGVGSDVAWPLPGNARFVGTGQVAKGMIASKGGGIAMGSLSLPIVGSVPTWMVVAGGVAVWWFFIRK